MLTDNRVLVENTIEQPAIMCVQRKAEKRISTEQDFIDANIASFGNDIGRTTNWITSMYEVQAGYERGSVEYDTLEYRIKVGQLIQQNVIDKAKGIIAKPMPREWHDRHSVNKIEDEEKRELYRRIVADKKPYFMRYIYPSLMKHYNTYIKNTNKNSLREFQKPIQELLTTPYADLTPRQQEFIHYYYYRMPVGLNDCVMNRICKRIEAEFDGYIGKHNAKYKFDYSIMKRDAEYPPRQFSQIKQLYTAYNRRLVNYAIFASYERVNEYDSINNLSDMNRDFEEECEKVCPNKDSLCNIILDICYTRSATKRFAWGMCGHEIIRNLLRRNGGVLHYPTMNHEGDIYYGGERFTLSTTVLEVDDL